MRTSFRPLLPAMLAAWARGDRPVLVFPRVLVETPAPPVLGKETLAGRVCLRFFPLNLEFPKRVVGRLSLVVRKYDLTKNSDSRGLENLTTNDRRLTTND